MTAPTCERLELLVKMRASLDVLALCEQAGDARAVATAALHIQVLASEYCVLAPLEASS